MMRIGFLVIKNIHRGGGIEKYTYEVGRRMVAIGHEVVVFSTGNFGEVIEQVEGMRVIKVPSLPWVATERLTASLSSILYALHMRPRFSVLHLHTPMTGAFGILPVLLGIPTVVQMHGVDWQRARWKAFARSTIRLLEYSAMKTVPICTAVSREQCAFYEKLYGRKIVFIPTGAQLVKRNLRQNALRTLGLEAGKFILFASRLVPEKGAHYLIEAFRGLNTDFKLVIAGGLNAQDRYSQSLREIAAQDPRILFPGFVEGELKEQTFSHAAVFVLPSEMEGLSIALLEAMSYGLPCLASNIPENLGALAHAGVTFISRDVDDLRKKLQVMIDQPSLREDLGRAALQRSVEEYSWDRTVEGLLDLYAGAMKAARFPAKQTLPNDPQNIKESQV